MKDLTTYTKEVLTNIEQSNFLSQADFDFLVDHKKNFQEIFEKKKIWRSRIDMEVSVLNDVKFPDNASKYWQCVKECDAFYNYLIELSFQYRRNQVKLKQLIKQLEISKDEFQIESLKIDIEELNYIISNQIQQAKDRVREIREWIDLMQELDDGSFDTQNLESSQLLSYTSSFIKKYIATKDNISGSEKTNLTGLLVTSLRRCKEDGIEKELLGSLNPQESEFINTLLKREDNEKVLRYN